MHTNNIQPESAFIAGPDFSGQDTLYSKLFFLYDADFEGHVLVCPSGNEVPLTWGYFLLEHKVDTDCAETLALLTRIGQNVRHLHSPATDCALSYAD